MIRVPVAILFLFCAAVLQAQKPGEVGLVSDNDLYSSPINDQYYTNGIEFYYRYLGTKNNEIVVKRITEFRIGQYIYNPQTAEAVDINLHDRPFAGYLFAQAGINTFYRKENVLKLSFQAGVVGPESKAEQLQAGLHDMVGYPRVKGWEYQIKTTIGLQARAFYSVKIFRNRLTQQADLYLQADVNAGTIWQQVSLGGMMRISLKGLLLPVFDSSFHGGSLRQDRQYNGPKELFLFLNPNVQYMRYDATIQGSLFNDDSPVTFPLIPFRFNADFGVKYRNNNWNLSYSVHYRGKELSNNVITGFYYGSIGIGYLL